MNWLKCNLLARASLGAIAAAAAMGAAAPAQAQVPQVINGGGATLTSVVLRDLFNCYGVPPGGTFADPLPANCTARVTPNYTYNYDSVGSGGGLRGWASQDRYGLRVTTGLPAPEFRTYENVAFGQSEAALTAAQLGFYNDGGRFSSTGPTDLADDSDNCVPPAAAGNGADNGWPAAGGANCNDNPRSDNGPAIQIPFAGTSVNIGFDPIYKWVRPASGPRIRYSYTLTATRGTSSNTVLRLSRRTICRVFSGEITTWNHPAITQDNQGVPVWPGTDQNGNPDPGPSLDPNYNDGNNIVIVHRDDDSGTTALFTRFLRAACGPTTNGTNVGTQFGPPVLGDWPNGFSVRFPGSPGAAIPSGSLECRGDVPVGTPGLEEAWDAPGYVFNATTDNTFFPTGVYLRARGNEGVAACVNVQEPQGQPETNIGGRIGYLSPSFTSPFAKNPPQSGYGLESADVRNLAGNWREPRPGTITNSLGALPPPTGADRNNPLLWVGDPSGVLPDGSSNPAGDPPTPAGYAIVGTGNWLLYTCASPRADDGTHPFGAERILRGLAGPQTDPEPGFLNWLYNAGTDAEDILKGLGFAPLPKALRQAIRTNFTNTAAPGQRTMRLAPQPSGTFVNQSPVGDDRGCTQGFQPNDLWTAAP
jgi:hypothetical protein